MNTYVLGADIGGTACKLGLFDASGKLLDAWEIPTDTSDEGKQVLPKVAEAFKQKLALEGIPMDCVKGLGMGLPGTMDRNGFFECPNLKWKRVNAEQEMQPLMEGVKIRALNDANAAALGEMWKGSGHMNRNLVMVTLGTGVGGGIVVDGKLLCGAHGGAGEIGYIVVNPAETEEFVGGPKGCLEQYASATGLVNMARRRLQEAHADSVLDTMEQLTAKGVFDACKEGDPLAEALVENYCNILGKGLARVSYVLNPDLYIIGGGVSKAGPLLLEKVQKAFLEDMQDVYKETKFVLATLGNDAGIYGAAFATLNM